MTGWNLLVVALLLGLAPGEIARRKGHGFLQWWLFGALVFVVALPVTLLMKPNPARRRVCPWCRSSIDSGARICPRCTRDVFAYYAEHGGAA